MLVLPDTTTFDSSIRLIQLVGGSPKVNMLKVCDKLDLAEKGQKGPTAKQLRMMAAMKRIMGE